MRKQVKSFAVRFVGTVKETPIMAFTMAEAKKEFADRERVPFTNYIIARKIKSQFDLERLMIQNGI